MISASAFRTAFPAFADATAFPDALVNFWAGIADKSTNLERWGNLADLGAMLFVAHNISLEAKSSLDASFGGIPGAAEGAVSSKSASGVSISFDTGSSAEADGGAWNMTVYGQRYIRYLRLFGAGPIQIGVDPFASSNYVGAFLG